MTNFEYPNYSWLKYMNSNFHKNQSYLRNLEKAHYHKKSIDELELNTISNKLKPFQSSFYSLNPLLFIIDYTNSQYLLLTEQILDIAGYHPKEFIDTKLNKLIDVFHPNDFQIFNQHVFEINRKWLDKTPLSDHDKFVFNYNFRIKDNNGKYVSLLQKSTYIVEPLTGTIDYSIGCIIDINDYKTDSIIIHSIECINEQQRQVVEKNYYYPDEQFCQLTKKEREVLLCTVDGLSNKEIGKLLHISENTVAIHRQNLLRKTNTKNVAALVAYAFRMRLI